MKERLVVPDRKTGITLERVLQLIFLGIYFRYLIVEVGALYGLQNMRHGKDVTWERCHLLQSASPCLPGKSWRQWDTPNASGLPDVCKWGSSSCWFSSSYQKHKLNSLEIPLKFHLVNGLRAPYYFSFKLLLICVLQTRHKERPWPSWGHKEKRRKLTGNYTHNRSTKPLLYLPISSCDSKQKWWGLPFRFW